MSECFLIFKGRIDGITPVEEKWLKPALMKVWDDFINGDTTTEGNFDYMFDVQQPEDKALPSSKSLFFQSEEGGDPEHVANFVQAFLKEFRPKDSFFLMYAYFNSKPHTNDSGGGAVYVTADKIRIQDASGFDEQCQAEDNSKKAKKH